jgi:hypothetical protein
VAPTTGSMCWDVVNQSGWTLYFKFYDENMNWVWPSSTQDWYTGTGQTVQECITCTLGDKICFGADNAAQSLYWGVGEFNNYSCTACCFYCASGTVSFTANP